MINTQEGQMRKQAENPLMTSSNDIVEKPTMPPMKKSVLFLANRMLLMSAAQVCIMNGVEEPK